MLKGKARKKLEDFKNLKFLDFLRCVRKHLPELREEIEHGKYIHSVVFGYGYPFMLKENPKYFQEEAKGFWKLIINDSRKVDLGIMKPEDAKESINKVIEEMKKTFPSEE